jgi:hypothetical protein
MKKIAKVCGYIAIIVAVIGIFILLFGILLIPAILLNFLLSPSLGFWDIPVIIAIYVFVILSIYGIILINKEAKEKDNAK